MLHWQMACDVQNRRREAGRRYRAVLRDRTLELPNAAAATEAAKSERDRLLVEEIDTWRKVEFEGRELGDPDFVTAAQEQIQKAIQEERAA